MSRDFNFYGRLTHFDFRLKCTIQFNNGLVTPEMWSWSLKKIRKSNFKF